MISRKIASLLFLLIFASQNTLFAQAENPDFFRSIGKMYVVVAVLLIVLIGIFLFLFYLERRISKMERSLGDAQS